MRFSTTRELGQLPRLKLLIHGPSGAGKTTLCGTTGDLPGTLIISAEAGLLPLRHLDILVAEVHTFQDVYACLEEARRMIARGEIRWVCLDSVSEIAEQCLANEKAQTKDGRAAYGQMADKMTAILKMFRDLPANVVMLAKQSREADDDGRVLARPSMPGKQLTGDLPYLFDEVFALRTGPADKDGHVSRFLQTGQDSRFDAKDRAGVLELYEAPDLGAIFAKIHPTGYAEPARPAPAPVAVAPAPVDTSDEAVMGAFKVAQVLPSLVMSYFVAHRKPGQAEMTDPLKLGPDGRAKFINWILGKGGELVRAWAAERSNPPANTPAHEEAA